MSRTRLTGLKGKLAGVHDQEEDICTDNFSCLGSITIIIIIIENRLMMYYCDILVRVRIILKIIVLIIL